MQQPVPIKIIVHSSYHQSFSRIVKHAVRVGSSLHLGVAGPRTGVDELLRLRGGLAAIIVRISDLMLRSCRLTTSERILSGTGDRNGTWRVARVVERLLPNRMGISHLENNFVKMFISDRASHPAAAMSSILGWSQEFLLYS